MEYGVRSWRSAPNTSWQSLLFPICLTGTCPEGRTLLPNSAQVVGSRSELLFRKSPLAGKKKN